MIRHQIRAVLLDLDGVVVFTDKYHYLAWKQLADEEGWAFDERVNHRLRGIPRMASLEVILQHNGVTLDEETKESLAGRKNRYYGALLERISEDDLYPGVAPFLEALRERGVPLGLCSSSRNAQTVLDSLDLGRFFGAVVTGHDIVHAKPDPEIFLKGAERLGVPPFHCLVFEDAESGVEAALRAGMKCIGVGPSELLPNAAETIRDYAELDLDTMLDTGRKASPPAEPWTLAETEPRPRRAQYWESLFALSNGYMGLRGTYEEDDPVLASHAYPGMFVNGVYDYRPYHYEWACPGFPPRGHAMVNLCDWRIVGLDVNDERFSMFSGQVSDYRRELDMRRGVVTRSLTWTSPAGRRVAIRTTRLVSMAREHAAAIRYEATPLDADCVLSFESVIRPRTESQVLPGEHTKVAKLVSDGDIRVVEVRTRTAPFRVALAVTHRLRLVAQPPSAVILHQHVAQPPSAVKTLEIGKSIVGGFTAGGGCATSKGESTAGGGCATSRGESTAGGGCATSKGGATAGGGCATSKGESTAGGGCATSSVDVLGESNAELVSDGENLTDRFTVSVPKGQTLTLDKHAAVYTNIERVEEDLVSVARNGLLEAVDDGFDTLLAEQEAFWARHWAVGDCEIDGCPSDQQALRFSLFHLRQSAPKDGRHSIGANGLTGDKYCGHVFWDTEMYISPYLLYTDPATVRPLLMYRYHLLDSARQRAREMEGAGALYSWNSISGEECGVVYEAATAEYHLLCAIATAIARYVRQTGDEVFLRHHGAEIVLETARFFADRGKFIPARGGQFCINAVCGPDEYGCGVNNNCYTNTMVQWHLRYACRIHDRLRDEHPEMFEALAGRIGLRPEERETWQRADDLMYLPYSAELGIQEQDDSFLTLDPVDMSKVPLNTDIREHHHPLNLWRMQVAKQADVVLLMFVQGDQFSVEQKRANYDFYEPRTCHGSSLSACIHSIVASEIGYADHAYHFFHQSARMDIHDFKNNTAAGVHSACLGGTWLALVSGFGGMRDYETGLRFAPTLPAQWTGYRFQVMYQGSRIGVAVTKEGATYRLIEGPAVSFDSAGLAVAISPEKPEAKAPLARPEVKREVPPSV